MVWMIYDGHILIGDECGPNFLTFVLVLRENPGKNLNQEIERTGDRTWDRCLRSNDITPLLQRWYLNLCYLNQTQLIIAMQNFFLS